MGGLGAGAVIQLILQYIGGSILKGSARSQIEGAFVAKAIGCMTAGTPFSVAAIAKALNEKVNDAASVIQTYVTNPMRATINSINEAASAVRAIADFTNDCIVATAEVAATMIGQMTDAMLGLVDSAVDSVTNMGMPMLSCVAGAAASIAKSLATDASKIIQNKVREHMKNMVSPLLAKMHLDNILNGLNAVKSKLIPYAQDGKVQILNILEGNDKTKVVGLIIRRTDANGQIKDVTDNEINVHITSINNGKVNVVTTMDKAEQSVKAVQNANIVSSHIETMSSMNNNLNGAIKYSDEMKNSDPEVSSFVNTVKEFSNVIKTAVKPEALVSGLPAGLSDGFAASVVANPLDQSNATVPSFKPE